jgi:hypothetical protein
MPRPNPIQTTLRKPKESFVGFSEELAAALAKFGDQWLEALPILLERLGVSDFETRHWALSGIWHLLLNGTGTESLTAALATARPSLAAIFRSEEEPIDLRRLAYQALLPSLFRPSFASPFDAPLQPETTADSVASANMRNVAGGCC